MRLLLTRADRRSRAALLVFPLLVAGCIHNADGVIDRPPVVSAGTAAIASELPLVGMRILPLPPGEGRDVAQTQCLVCHAPEMILQQRLTETQWRAEVDKMRRWGAAIDDAAASALVKYLVPRFGPDNDRFDPVVASPRRSADPTGGTR